jgi:NADH-quinone oxidoreductase subunit C
VDATSIISTLQPLVPGAEFAPVADADRPTIMVPRQRLADTCQALRDEASLAFILIDITAVDWWPADPRFHVVYHLVSPGQRAQLRLKVALPGADPHVATVQGVWPAAAWLEREVWDLFGVFFDGHPDLRRLMMPDDWEGHPLRKDYPVQIKMKPKVYEPLQMTTEEFQANLQADRAVRGEPRAPKGRR